MSLTNAPSLRFHSVEHQTQVWFQYECLWNKAPKVDYSDTLLALRVTEDDPVVRHIHKVPVLVDPVVGHTADRLECYFRWNFRDFFG